MNILNKEALKVESKKVEIETIAKEEQTKFETSLKYGLGLLDGVEVEYDVHEINNNDIEALEKIYDSNEVLSLIENNNYILQIKLDILTGEKVERVYLFKDKDVDTSVSLVLNEIGMIVSKSFEDLVLDTINLSGKETLYVTEDLMYDKYIRKESVGIEFSESEKDALKQFDIETVEVVSYADTDKEISYNYNLITDPLGNQLNAFLIATADGVVVKLKKGTFGLVNYKNMTSIELKFFKEIVNTLQALNLKVALDKKLTVDSDIWDSIDDSTITNIKKVKSNNNYKELKFKD